MTIDWGSQLDRMEEDTKPISIGKHTFRVVEAKPTTANSGNQMIVLTCKVEGGPDAGKTGYVNLVFAFENPRALKMTVKRLAALGVSQEMLKKENLSYEQIAGRLIGRSAVGDVTHREWPAGSGEMSADINFIASAGGAGPVASTMPAATTLGPTTATPTSLTPAEPPKPDVAAIEAEAAAEAAEATKPEEGKAF